ncbi:hypothetical protein KIN20_005995 [Parelaphostrongylus tenuis]|uniref:Uncharacterized protein n=1 Tax=Parelaphostrongylus tenuis TaxID=148309 RepID=A0AAD5M5D7_PARTN|nr:hypothetical protein KIN20_005995 [Parelaphostrongylus tenuis]
MSSSTIAMWQKKNRHSVTPIVLSGMILLIMLSLGNMAKVPTRSLPILLLATGAVLGCGTVPAEAFVKRLIIQGVLDVLEQQGRAAGLPDSVITTILGQLGINVLYTPLPCPKVSVDPPQMVMRDPQPMMMTTCVIFGNTVTTTCLGMGAPGIAAAAAAQGGADMCRLGMVVDFTPISPQHLSISGTLMTSNLIMANWSREMWQSVVNRVLRMITSGPFGTQFATAAATVT